MMASWCRLALLPFCALMAAGCFHDVTISPDDHAVTAEGSGGAEGGAADGLDNGDAGTSPDLADPSIVDSLVGHKRIFMSRDGWNGNLGGLPGADQKCQAAADYERLGGTWRAWLSDATANAIDRIADAGPWYTMNRHLAFRDKAQLRSTPSAKIEYDEAGGIVAASSYWTGTLLGGARADDLCQNWTSSTETDSGDWGDGRPGTEGRGSSGRTGPASWIGLPSRPASSPAQAC